MNNNIFTNSFFIFVQRAAKESDKQSRERSNSRDHRSSKDKINQRKPTSRDPAQKESISKKSTTGSHSKPSRNESVERKHVRKHTKNGFEVNEEKLKKLSDENRKYHYNEPSVSSDNYLKSTSRKENVKSNRNDQVNGVSHKSHKNETKAGAKRDSDSKHKHGVSLTRQKTSSERDRREKHDVSSKRDHSKAESSRRARTSKESKQGELETTDNHHSDKHSSRHGSRTVPAENSVKNDGK